MSDTTITPTEQPTSAPAKTPAIVLSKLTDLKPHPLNITIYGETQPSTDLLESIHKRGIHTPLVISKKNVILSGHTRYLAAQELGLAEVPVVVFEDDDELAQKEVLIDTNQQRIKTEEQRAREYILRKEIEAEKAKRRQATNQGADQPRKNLPEAEKGKAADKAAEKVDRSRPTAEKASSTVRVVDKLTSEGKKEEAAQIRTLLNTKSVSAAYNKCVTDGHIILDEKKKKTQKPDQAKVAVTKVPPAPTPAPKAPAPALTPAIASPGFDDELDDNWLGKADALETYLREMDMTKLPKPRRKTWQTMLSQMQALLAG